MASKRAFTRAFNCAPLCAEIFKKIEDLGNRALKSVFVLGGSHLGQDSQSRRPIQLQLAQKSH